MVNPEKCVIGQPVIKFLGHEVSAAGMSPLASQVEAIVQFPRPTTIKELQRFLGLINFYRRFLPAAAALLRPFTDALRGNPKSLEWSPAMEAAYDRTRAALAEMATLTHPVPGAKLSLATDASNTHVGAALQQWQAGAWRPLAYFSQKLDGAQSKYSTFDRELLAVHAAIRHFRCTLEGRQFTVFTDHRPLVAAIHRVSQPWSARQQRQLSYILEFTTDLQYMPGPDNAAADVLSRPPTCFLGRHRRRRRTAWCWPPWTFSCRPGRSLLRRWQSARYCARRWPPCAQPRTCSTRRCLWWAHSYTATSLPACSAPSCQPSSGGKFSIYCTIRRIPDRAPRAGWCPPAMCGAG